MMHCHLKAARRRASRSGLLLAKFVLRMRKNCYMYLRASAQISDTSIGMDPNFLHGTYILANSENSPK